MKFKIPTGWIVAAALALLLAVQWQCHRMDKPGEPAVISHTDTVPGDSVPYQVLVPAPYPEYRDTGQARWISLPVDTDAIVAECNNHNYYRTVFKDDSSAFIEVIDTVFRNRLLGRGLNYQNRRPTQINNTISQITPNRLKIYAGVTASAGLKPGTLGIAPTVFAITPNDQAYGVAYDISNQALIVTAAWKIGFRRKVP